VSDIRDTLNRVGIGTAELDRVRLARGVIGKASYVAAAAIIALAAVAWGLREPVYLLIDGVLVVVLFALYFGGSLWFAHRHPDTALLEGAELLQWRQLEIAASNAPLTLDRQKTEPPTLIGGSE